MKSFTMATLLAAASTVILCSCETFDEADHRRPVSSGSTTTTTEETSVRSPATNTVETQTTRLY